MLHRVAHGIYAEGAEDPRRASRVELISWMPPGGGFNFGDDLSRVVVAAILARHSHMLDEAVPQPARLLAIGSILHLAETGDVLWGTGLNGNAAADWHKFANLDVRAVRGPLTGDFLRAKGIEVPDVYGDPAILLPTLFGGRFRRAPRLASVFVPNLFDLPLAAGWPDVVSPVQPWNLCVDRILEAEFVMASSLHGLVVAEAFGIPARLVRMSEPLLKYEDYYAATGRRLGDVATSREAALEMGGMPPPRFDWRKLLSAFPLDLWGEAGPTESEIADEVKLFHGELGDVAA